MDYKKLVKNYEQEALKTLQELICINSVYDASTISKNAPYGQGVENAMKFMNDLALKDGFNVDRCDNRCIEISCGEGEEYIGIFAHLDTVPVSGNWKFGAWDAVIDNDKLYGRGTSDDKGPGIAAYYALKALKDNGLINGYKVKLVFGGDEERGSSCLNYYFDTLKKPAPKYGFTPDGDFPLIYGEKGITNYEVSKKFANPYVYEIKAGVASNSVIDSAIVKCANTPKLKTYLNEKCCIEKEILAEDEKTISINFIGKSAHGSLPNLGKNSGIIALKVLSDVFNIAEFKEIYEQYNDVNGKGLDIYQNSEAMGETTVNVGIINYDGENFNMIVNFRYPETLDIDETIETIKKNSSFEVKVESTLPCLYYDINTPFIQTLYKVYVDETNDLENKPMTIGGGTYAKEAKNTVAFGSHFPGKEDHIHEENEKIDLEDFYTSMSLYAHAIDALGKLK